jgi:crotonobetainyl-CoA:carnitine CoA-transferase CaiB-like acyl-CoA transferase
MKRTRQGVAGSEEERENAAPPVTMKTSGEVADGKVEGALSGIRVLDLSRVLAGPLATQMLADLGADVVKVEAPWGDDTRGWGPPFVDLGDEQAAAYYIACNRGKRSIAIDARSEKGRAEIERLIAAADIVVENFRAGTLAKWNLAPADLIAKHPGLIVCSITGFGQTGPRADEAGYDVALQGISGIMSVTGEAEGAPVKVGVAWIDVLTGLNASSAILAALFHKERTGEGQTIDIALFDVALAALVNQAQNWLTTKVPPGRLGHAHPNIVPYQAFEASDGWFILATGNDRQYVSVCQVVARDDLMLPHLLTNEGRLEHRDTVVTTLADIFATKKVEHWIDEFSAVGVPTAPIHDIAQAFTDPQAVARGALWTLDNGIPSIASPLRFMSATPAKPSLAPPMLNADAESIRRDWLAD